MPHKQAKTSDSDELTVYSPDMTLVYLVPPIVISPTEGSASLFKNYDTYGAYMRKEHFLCTNSMAGQCPHGRRCLDIHLDPEQGSRVKSSRVHRNIEHPTVARHAAGKGVEVFDHKTRETLTVASERVLVTAGSEEYFKKADMGETVPRMQQCTHFQRKHCLRGPECCFLHVLNYRPIEVPKKPKIRNYRRESGGTDSTPGPYPLNLSLSGPLPSPGLSLSGLPMRYPASEGGTPGQSLTSLEAFQAMQGVPQQPQVVYILPQGGQMPQFMAMPQGAMMQTVQQPGQFVQQGGMMQHAVPQPGQQPGGAVSPMNPLMMGFPPQHQQAPPQMMYYFMPSYATPPTL
jgi:hypothetical protein